MPMRVLNEQAPKPSRAPRFERIGPRPFQITERDLDVLEGIGTYEVVQSTRLDVLFPEASSDKLRRRLNAYFHAGLVARPEAQRAYLLEQQGSRAMAYLLTEERVPPSSPSGGESVSSSSRATSSSVSSRTNS